MRKTLKFHLISWCGNFQAKTVKHTQIIRRQKPTNCLKVFDHFCLKFCGNCAFPQNFYTRKLGKILVFYAVVQTLTMYVSMHHNLSRYMCYLVDKRFLQILQGRFLGDIEMAHKCVNLCKFHWWTHFSQCSIAIPPKNVRKPELF